MRRIFATIAAVIAVVCLAVAPGTAETESPDSVTFDKLVAANATAEVLARHGNVRMTRITYHGDEKVLTESCYRADGIFLWNYGDGHVMLRRPDCFIDRGFSDDILFGATVFDSAETCAVSFEEAQAEAFVGLYEEETLVNTRVTDSGLFIAETRCSNPIIVRQALGETEYTGSYKYADGMVMDFRYTFDTASSDLVGLESFIVDAEGNSYIYQAETYEYGIEPYDPAADSALFADYFAAASVPENLRTIRVVFDPGTENEKTAEAALPVNVWFSVFYNGTFAKEVYTDRECTQPLTDDEVKEDLVVYVRSE